jgi:hypothetical protein
VEKKCERESTNVVSLGEILGPALPSLRQLARGELRGSVIVCWLAGTMRE